MTNKDEVIRLREWGTDRTHELQRPVTDAWLAGHDVRSLRFGGEPTADVVAHLTYERGRWSIRDLGADNGLRRDGASRREFVIEAGVAIGVGDTTLIAESQQSIALRNFVARILGWGSECATNVDDALRSILLSSASRTTLMLSGESDVVPVALALHRRTLDAERPFIVCDPRRGNTPASVRSPANYENGVAAFYAARGGSLCVRSHRLPRDFSSVAALVRDPNARVQLIVCGPEHGGDDAFLVSSSVRIPSLRGRVGELPRIVDEYALDAITALGERGDCFTDDDRQWILEHAATTLPEIEKATMRMVALKTSANVSSAAARLGMAPVSLWRWALHRDLSPVRIKT
jgi:hypothetical protein